MSNIMNRAGRKAERKKRAETHCFLAGRGITADGTARRVKAFQDPDGLEKLEPIPFFEEDLF
jgi:hypothetical protein